MSYTLLRPDENCSYYRFNAVSKEADVNVQLKRKVSSVVKPKISMVFTGASRACS
jgi:hypothetical protein